MRRRILQRILTALISLWAVLTVAYACLYLLPGDPARIILGPQASTESVLEFRHAYGLDRPWPEQYTSYITRTARLDLGYSFAQRRSVRDLLIERSRASLTLMAIAAILSLVAGVVLPLVLKSLNGDRLISAISGIFQLSAFIPSYVLAIIALIAFAGWFHWIPVIFSPENFLSWATAAAVLAAYPIALLLKIFLGRVNDELTRPYARRTVAQGFSRSHQLWREVLPNALPTALAVFANNLAFFVTGAFFVEVVFGVPGLGWLAQAAIGQKDIAVLSGVCVTFAVFVLSLSLVFDIATMILSPRAVEDAL